MAKKIVFKYRSLSYLLWFGLGSFGVHRMYLRRFKSGLLIGAYSIGTVIIETCLPLFFPEMPYSRQDDVVLLMTVPVWGVLLFDLFHIHIWVKQFNLHHNPNMILF